MNHDDTPESVTDLDELVLEVKQLIGLLNELRRHNQSLRKRLGVLLEEQVRWRHERQQLTRRIRKIIAQIKQDIQKDE